MEKEMHPNARGDPNQPHSRALLTDPRSQTGQTHLKNSIAFGGYNLTEAVPRSTGRASSSDHHFSKTTQQQFDS